MTPLAVPGLAIALGLIITYGGVREFRSHWTFILVGPCALYAPLHGAIRSRGAIVDRPQDAGGGCGKPRCQLLAALLHIGLPNARAGIVAGSLMVVTLSVGEFNITWMLHTPINKTVPVGLADSYASMRIEIGSAYTTIFLLMIVPLLLLIQYIAEPARRRLAGRGEVAQPAGST